MASLGLFFALGALVSWGIGDFFIQRATRRIGIVSALFWIGIAGALGLFPFVIFQLPLLATGGSFGLLLLVSGIGILAALFDFEALRRGKIAIVEPVVSLELPLTVGLSVALHGERLTLVQSLLILMVFIGIVLAVTTNRSHFHLRRLFERGAFLAGAGAAGLALTNFLTGLSSQTISPLLTVWFIHAAAALACFIYLIMKGRAGELHRQLKRHPFLIVLQSIFDTVGWVAYASATTLLPISIVTTISESYIALAVFLGIFVGRERLQRYQLAGAILAFAGVILLSYLVGTP